MAPTLTTEQRSAVVEAAVRRPEKPEGFKSETARKLAGRVDEENPRVLLEELRQRRPVENPAAQHLIERNIAGEKDSGGSIKRSPEQQRRFEEANRWNTLNQALVEKGIDSLSPDQRKNAIDQVRDVLKRLPEAERLWWNLSVDQINDEVTRLLKDPDFIARIREARSEATGESRIISIDVVAAQAKLEATKTKKGQAERSLAHNNGERDNVTARLEQFEDRTATGGSKGTKLQELEKLEREAPDQTARLEELERLSEEAQARLRDLENTQLAFAVKGKALPEMASQLGDKRAEVDKYRREISTIRRDLSIREALQREKAELQETRGQLEQQRIDLEKAVNETIRDHSLAQAELDGVSLERSQAEEEFVAGLRNVLRDGTFAYLEDKITNAEQSLNEMLKEEIAQTQDTAEKAFISGIRGRYVGKPQKERRGGFLGVGAKDVWVPGLPKGEVIDGDYQKYVESGNSLHVVKGLLDAGRDPTPGERLLTDEQVTNLLTDKEFIEKMGPRAIEELLRARLKTGDITENEATIIANYDGGAAAIEAAIKKDPRGSEFIEEIQAKTGEEDLQKAVKRLSGKSILAILLMILSSALASSISTVDIKRAIQTA